MIGTDPDVGEQGVARERAAAAVLESISNAPPREFGR